MTNLFTSARGTTTLVVAAHPDDETLGCGGTIARLAAAGGAVYVIVAFCHDEDSGDLSDVGGRQQSDRYGEFFDACSTLGVKDCEVLRRGGMHDVMTDNPARLVHDIESGASFSLDAVHPDIMLIPSGGAFHQEHEALHRACFSAARMDGSDGPGRPPVVLGYSGPEDFWSTEGRAAHVQVDISQHFEVKVSALQIYQRQMKADPHPRSVEGVRALDRAAGVRAGVEYAEEFSVYRMSF